MGRLEEYIPVYSKASAEMMLEYDVTHLRSQ